MNQPVGPGVSASGAAQAPDLTVADEVVDDDGLVVDMARARLVFATARARAVETRPRSGPVGLPYLAKALFSMVPVPTFSVDTMAVDRSWRVYWNPATILRWGVEASSGVLLHEVGHLLREHAARFVEVGDPYCMSRVFGCAADAAINEDLRDGGWALPDSPWYPEGVPGGKPGMIAEELYRLLRADMTAPAPPEDAGQGKPDDEAQDGDQDDAGDQADKSGEPTDDENDNENDDPTDGDPGNQHEGQPRSDEGDQVDGEATGATGDTDSHDDNADGEDRAGRDGTADSDPDDQPDEAGHQDAASGEPATRNGGRGSGMTLCPIHGDKCPDRLPAQGCGSGADGEPRPWELPPDDPSASSVSEARARLIRQQVAVAIREHARARGTVPGGWDRWAAGILEPKIDWKRELRAFVSKRLSRVAGREDYSYQRPSRRSFGTGVILPGMRQMEPPQIVVIVDTSGSVSDLMLAQVLGELKKLLRTFGGAAGGTGLELIYCDAAPTETTKIHNVKDVRFVGGGGTDMRVGMAAVAEMEKPPHVGIVATDGYTPWPQEPPVPDMAWAALIVNEGTPDKAVLTGVPDWMIKLPVDATA